MDPLAAFLRPSLFAEEKNDWHITNRWWGAFEDCIPRRWIDAYLSVLHAFDLRWEPVMATTFSTPGGDRAEAAHSGKRGGVPVV
jgi:hypothetical protein